MEQALCIGKPIKWTPAAEDGFQSAFQTVRQKKSNGIVPLVLSDGGSGERCAGFLMTRDVVPMGTAQDAGGFHYAIMLAAHKGPSLGAALLKENLHLTNAEWLLAQTLQKGMTLADAAEELGVTISTARSTLKQVFAKLQVHKQSELVSLLNDASQIVTAAPVETAAGVNDPGRRFLTLPDGRKLAYRDYGPGGGIPNIFFHTTLHASLLQAEATVPAIAAGMRLIAVDRPGFGHSTPAKIYDFDSVALDVEALLHQLGLGQVALSGSGVGGAFALALARRLGARVVCIVLMEPRLSKMEREAGTGLFHRAHSLIVQQRWFHRAVGEIFHRGRHRAMALMYVKRTDEGVAASDRKRADPKFIETQIARSLDAFEKTGQGVADELTLLARHAGVSPEGIECPIGVWHGRENAWIPVEETIRHFQDHPTADLFILDDVGAYAPSSVFDDVIAWTLARWREQASRGERHPVHERDAQGMGSV
ncbi:MAG: alpha/beta hydrolase [Micropepsaceae bacterium]